MEADQDDDPSSDQQEGAMFTPKKVVSDSEKFTGVCLKTFPKDTDQSQIVDLLEK